MTSVNLAMAAEGDRSEVPCCTAQAQASEDNYGQMAVSEGEMGQFPTFPHMHPQGTGEDAKVKVYSQEKAIICAKERMFEPCAYAQSGA